MTIKIKPQVIESDTTWEPKMEGVIFVEKEEDIEPLWKLLCVQDDYWEDYKFLIRVSPGEINKKSDLKKYCEYVGKTDIYDVKSIQEQIPFFIYQYKDWD